MSDLMRAAVYCCAKHGSTHSLDTQQARCAQRVLQEGAETVAMLFDEQATRPMRCRPGITELLALLRTERINLVVVDGPERLTPSVLELRALGQEVSRAGSRLIFVKP